MRARVAPTAGVRSALAPSAHTSEPARIDEYIPRDKALGTKPLPLALHQAEKVWASRESRLPGLLREALDSRVSRGAADLRLPVDTGQGARTLVRHDAVIAVFLPVREAIMEPHEVDALLGMIKELGRTVDRYLAGKVECAEAVPRIVDACKQMQAKRLTDGPAYWIRALEHHAGEILNPRERSGALAHYLGSGEFLRIQLLKDLYYLRSQLLNARTSPVPA